MNEAHKLQLLHYMYIINKENKDIFGKLRYPELNKVINLELDSGNIEYYIDVKDEIIDIITGEIPDIKWKSACKSCSMREFCHS